MFKTVNYGDVDGNVIFIDVRSPKEYNDATIPGATNIPLFDDEERNNIGWVYVNQDVERAKALGVEAVSKKLPSIFSQLNTLDKKYDKLILFCARGGMRSSSLTALLGTLGLNTFKLSGGYKGYRAFINQMLPTVNENVKYIVLHGKTGVGKTELLKVLKLKGFNVLDLEEAANHRGSLLGSVGLNRERSQKQFEALIYEALKVRNSEIVFVEGESKRIGNIIIPDFLYKRMEEGIHVLVDANIDFRCKLIIDEYTKKENSKEDILNSLDLLRKYISSDRIDHYKELINKGNYNSVAEDLMLKYYDPMYLNGIKKYKFDLEVNVSSIDQTSNEIEKWFYNELQVSSNYNKSCRQV